MVMFLKKTELVLTRMRFAARVAKVRSCLEKLPPCHRWNLEKSAGVAFRWSIYLIIIRSMRYLCGS